MADQFIKETNGGSAVAAGSLADADGLPIQQSPSSLVWTTLGNLKTSVKNALVVPIATFVFDGAGSAPTAGTVTNPKPIPAGYTITGYTIIGDATGSAIVDVQMATGGGSTFSSVVASAPPTLSSARRGNNTTLTGWTTTVPSGADLRASLTSASTLTKLTVVIYGVAS